MYDDGTSGEIIAIIGFIIIGLSIVLVANFCHVPSNESDNFSGKVVAVIPCGNAQQITLDTGKILYVKGFFINQLNKTYQFRHCDRNWYVVVEE